jgi:hypothetical protein
MIEFFLFVSVNGKWKGGVNSNCKFCHVVVDLRLGDGSICILDVIDKIMEGDAIEALCGVVK